MDKNNRQHLAEAKKLQHSGELVQAKRIYQQLLADNPDNPDALHFLGMLHYQENDVYKAVELISKCITVQADYADAYLNLGNILLKLNEAKEAYACYSKAYELDPERYETLANFGILLRHAGEFVQSKALLLKACKIRPTEGVAHYNLALSLQALGQLDEALQALELCIEHSAHFEPAYTAYASMCYRAGCADKAADVYRKRLQANPGDVSTEHMLAAVSGENVPARAAAEYTRLLFDQHAATFEHNLNQLGYQTPQQLGIILEEILPNGAMLDVLDACCGTGLCAQYLQPFAKHLTGLDLSSGMLNGAREKQLYDELVCADLTDYLADKEAAFDVIVSCDALIYFGDLRQVMAQFSDALVPGGLLVFSLEQATDVTPAPDGYALAPHGRYLHTHAYIAQLLEACQLTIKQVSACVVRKELGVDVDGWMCVAVKP